LNFVSFCAEFGASLERNSGGGGDSWRPFVQVKPHYLDPVMEALKPHIHHQHLIISIVAGVKLAWLENSLPGARLVSPRLRSAWTDESQAMILWMHEDQPLENCISRIVTIVPGRSRAATNWVGPDDVFLRMLCCPTMLESILLCCGASLPLQSHFHVIMYLSMGSADASA
jgi:hypothetical protein